MKSNPYALPALQYLAQILAPSSPIDGFYLQYPVYGTGEPEFDTIEVKTMVICGDPVKTYYTVSWMPLDADWESNADEIKKSHEVSARKQKREVAKFLSSQK